MGPGRDGLKRGILVLSAQGIALPARHLIYVRDADGGHQPDPLVVSIVVSDMRFA